MSDTDDSVKQDTDEEDDRDDDYYNENCIQMLIKSSSFDRLCSCQHTDSCLYFMRHFEYVLLVKIFEAKNKVIYQTKSLSTEA